jgi:heptaprenyl diphosphate synthase
MKKDTKKLATLAMIVAMASAVHYLEGLLPPVLPSVPGTKLGLANIFSLFALVTIGVREGYAVVVLRCLVGTLIGGSVTGFIYALSGGLLSYTVMALFRRLLKDRLSLYGLSAVGAFFHNVGQILAACLVMGNTYVLYYFPYLALVAVPTGLLTGFACSLCIRSLKRGGLLH